MQIGSSHIASTYGARSLGGINPHGGHEDEEVEGSQSSTGHAGKDATEVSLSPAARKALEAQALGLGIESKPGDDVKATSPGSDAKAVEAQSAQPAKEKLGPGELTEEEEQQVVELKARDAEVRAHEQAHVAASGGLTNGPIHYDYQRGPDNQQYAIGGHVSIDTAPIPGEPEKTIQKAETIRRSALAPAEPSGADKRIAAKASQMASAARQEMAVEAQEEQALAKEEAEAKREEEEAAQDSGPRPTVTASRAMASYAMAA